MKIVGYSSKVLLTITYAFIILFSVARVSHDEAKPISFFFPGKWRGRTLWNGYDPLVTDNVIFPYRHMG